MLPVGKKQEFLKNYLGSAWTEGGADALKLCFYKGVEWEGLSCH